MAQNRDLLHYVIEYGDRDFEQMPFSVVDALALCQLAYPDLEVILPQEDETGGPTNTVWQEDFRTWEELLAHPDADKMFTNTIYGSYYREFMEAVSTTRRFGSVRAGMIRSLLSKEHNSIPNGKAVPSEEAHQFCGVTMLLPGERLFIAFRGTDDKLAGWKESMNYGYMPVVPSAEMALQYLTDIASIRDEQAIFTGGHSKGGMVTVYAAAKAPEEIQKRLSGVFSFDGIGMGKSFCESEGYQRIRSKLTKIVPEDSVVGMLFETTTDYLVTASGSIGIKQHDFLNWRIRKGQFVYRDGLKPSAAKRAARIQLWIDALPLEERQEFIRLIFQTLDNIGVDENNIYALQDNLLGTVIQTAGALRSFPAEEKQKIRDTIRKLL